MFITNKLWNTCHDPKDVRNAIEGSLKKLNLDYVDLYLIHWPVSYEKSDKPFPANDSGEMMFANVDLLDTWRAMEKLVDAGLAKSIGVSNFNIKQVDYIISNARIQPVVNQIETHPYLLNKKLIKYCRTKNIIVTAYSPLGAPNRPWASPGSKVLFNEPKLLQIAEKLNKTPAQILIRYQVQIGNVAIPKSASRERLISNLNVFDFSLTDEDINEIETFGCIDRTCAAEHDKKHPEFPFHDE